MTQHRSIPDLIFAWRPLVYRVTGAAAVIAVVASLLMPNWYGATATFLPPSEREARGSFINMFNQIGLDFGTGGLLSTTPATDLLIGILRSRLVRGRVVDRFDLKRVYDSETREHAVEDLGEHLRVNTTSEGLIEVWVEDRDKERAANMANAFVEFLDNYNRTSSVEQAQRTREFIEGMLRENRGRLEQAANELKEFRQEHRAVELTEQTRVTVEAIARLESEQTQLEIERGILDDFSMPDEVQMRQNEARLREIGRQLAELRGGGADGQNDSVAFLPLSEIPGLALTLADLTREVMVQEKVYEFLSGQLEEARIQEARDLESVRVLDAAVPPLKKSRPRRSVICILTVLLALAGSVGMAFFAEGFLERAEGGRLTGAAGDSRESRALLGFLRWIRAWGGPKGERRGFTSHDS